MYASTFLISFLFYQFVFMQDKPFQIQCKSQIYCQGALLDRIQMSRIFSDSKTFVDMPSRFSESAVLEDFTRTNPQSQNEIQLFLQKNFLPSSSDLLAAEISDWQEEPRLLNSIVDNELKNWARQLNIKWKHLIKTYNSDVLCKDCVYSSILLPFPFVIPGGRFREFYYWDTFWIVEGLIACGMLQTVKGIIKNFVELVKIYGFIPNCSRIYCLNRTQPPVFPRIVQAYIKETNDIEFLNEIIKYLDTEYDFWMSQRIITIKVKDKAHILNIFKTNNYSPRPESYREDYNNAHKYSSANRQKYYYENVASIAESGWDFSSRWYFNKDIISSDILRIIPVDLNAFMLKNEQILSELHEKINSPLFNVYKERWEVRKDSIEAVFWNQSLYSWFDFDTEKMAQRKDYYISNLLPLLDSDLKNELSDEILKKHHRILFGHLAGIPISSTSRRYSGQQWDYPNAWGPYEYFLVNWLHRNGKTAEAINVSQRWINSTFCGFYRTGGYLFEKYDVEQMGQPGVGGEYIVQEGFGWTNGVIFYMIKLFSKELSINSSLKEKCAPSFGIIAADYGKSNMPHHPFSHYLAVTFLLVIGSGIFGLYLRNRKQSREYLPIDCSTFDNLN